MQAITTLNITAADKKNIVRIFVKKLKENQVSCLMRRNILNRGF